MEWMQMFRAGVLGAGWRLGGLMVAGVQAARYRQREIVGAGLSRQGWVQCVGAV
jgi:hypothetical protein